MDMGKIVGVIISITVSIIVIGSVLAPQIATFTGEGGALASYSALLGAVVIMAIVAVMMLAVRLISNKN